MMKEKVMMLNFRLTLTRTSKKKTQIISTKMTWVSVEYILPQLRCYMLSCFGCFVSNSFQVKKNINRMDDIFCRKHATKAPEEESLEKKD